GLGTVPGWVGRGDAAWRRGALLGFDGSQGRAHIYRSILEGIALTMANNTAAMERGLGRRLSPVLVSGGGSRSDLMMQIVADVFDRPARRTAVNDAAGLGAAAPPPASTRPDGAGPSGPPSGTASPRTGTRPRSRWSPRATRSLRTRAPPAPTSRSTRCMRPCPPSPTRCSTRWPTASAAWTAP